MYLETVSVSSIVEAAALLGVRDRDVLLILIGEKTDVLIERLTAGLNKEKLLFFGGLFPAILWGEKQFSRGAIVKKFPLLQEPVLIKGLSRRTWEQSLDIKIPSNRTMKSTAVIFADALAGNVEAFLNHLGNLLENRVSFLGAGAGSLRLKRQACVFCHKGAAEDAAVFCIINAAAEISFSHGWRDMFGPVVATKTKANIIYELNWQPAFDIYKEIVEGDSGRILSRETFLEHAKAYPLGMFREGGDKILRDPIAAGSAGELLCLGEVPVNTVIYIMKGKKENLLKATEALASKLKKSQIANDLVHPIIINCFSRAMFLENDFQKELRIIQEAFTYQRPENLLQGALSMGEIASMKEGALEMHNKTLVAGRLKISV